MGEVISIMSGDNISMLFLSSRLRTAFSWQQNNIQICSEENSAINI